MYVNPLKLEMKQKHMDRQMKKTKAKIAPSVAGSKAKTNAITNKTKSSFFQRKGIGLRQVLALWIRIPNSLMHIVGFSDV